jgi:hypothetical protein
MKEVFQVFRASFAINGGYPVRITAAGKSGANEFTAVSIILSNLPGKESAMQFQGRVSGKLRTPLAEYEWAEALADEVSASLMGKWEDELFKTTDPILGERLRISGYPEWIEQKDAEKELVRYALRAGVPLFDHLCVIVDVLPQSKAAATVERVAEITRMVRFSDE